MHHRVPLLCDSHPHIRVSLGTKHQIHDMTLVLIIDILVVAGLVAITLMKGVESTLPFLGFSLILLPNESKIAVPGLFDLTSSRIAIITFVVLYLALGRKEGSAGSGQGNPLKLLMLLTIGWSLISTANSIVFTTSLKTVISQICDDYLLYYLFLKNYEA